MSGSRGARGAFGLLSGAIALAGCAPCTPVAWLDFERVPVPRYSQALPRGSDDIAVVGDLQRTSFEGCLLCNEVNDREQELLLGDLGGQPVGAVVLLGDLVFKGDAAAHWAYFDHLMAASGLARRPLFPVLGNHDYWMGSGPSLSQVRRRFGTLDGPRYHAFTWGAVRLVFLDTNRAAMTLAEWKAELAWLDADLEKIRGGPERGVVLFGHHSPYTQSPWAPDDEHVKRDVVPRFCASPLRLAFISAHAHGYERWHSRGDGGCASARTPFIVSAGGGGPRPPRRRGDAPRDAAPGLGWPRPFNYLTLHQTASSLDVTVHVLAKGMQRVVVEPALTEHLALRRPAASVSAAGAASIGDRARER